MIGLALVDYLGSTIFAWMVGMVRPRTNYFSKVPLEYRFCDLSLVDETSIYLNDIDIIIHTAARVHQMNEQSSIHC